MVMGHVGFGGYFDHFIHAFHMPMFFFISGMFFKSGNDILFFVKKKAKTLLLPYGIFGGFHYLVCLFLHQEAVSVSPLLHLLSINTDGLPIAGALWFLTALFFAEIVYFFLCKYLKNDKRQHLLVALIALFGCVATLILPYRLPYALDAAFVGVGLMHIGHLFKKYERNISRLFNLKIFEFLLLGIAVSILIFVNGYINMRTGSYAIVPLFWINAVLAIIVGINLAKYFECFALETVRTYLASIGKNSIVYLCLNQLVILVVKYFVRIMVPISSILSNIIALSISMLGLYIIQYVMTNTRLGIVFGKF